jgi:hypothetical protein
MEPSLTWSQHYAPLGTIGLSTLVAVLPVATLLGLLAFWHVRAHVAALAGLGVAAAIAVAVYGMPVPLVLASAAYGATFGLFPIGWIILNAIFVYSLSVETGQFAVLQRQVAGLSADRRIQALLIAFSFGAFIEGAAGFGAPIAISGALLIGLGFRPLEAAKLALIGNTAPVAYGALGTPLITLARITDLDLQALSAMVGRQLPVFSIIVPFWLVWAQAGRRGMVGVWPACLVTGVSFGAAQFLVSNYHGPWLVDIISAPRQEPYLMRRTRSSKTARRPKPGCRGSSSPSSCSRGVCPRSRAGSTVCSARASRCPGCTTPSCACRQWRRSPNRKPRSSCSTCCPRQARPCSSRVSSPALRSACDQHGSSPSTGIRSPASVPRSSPSR